MSRTGIDVRRGVWMALGLWAAAMPLGAQEETPHLDVPFVPTHQRAVEEMLKIAKVTSEDFVIDLGCGDGRIVVTAAKQYKAHALGVDLDPRRIKESNANAKKSGVTDMVEFRLQNVMETDVSKASVVTLFLLESVNVLLRPNLFAQLKPGTRVVSNSFTMRDWKPDKQIDQRQAFSRVIYFWLIPASVGGEWTWQTKIGDKEVPGSVKLEQEFQAVQGKIALPEAADLPIAEAVLAGKDLSFTATMGEGDKKVVVAYKGTVEADALKGTQEWRGGPNAGTYPWVAARKPVDVTGKWQIQAASHADSNGTLVLRRDGGAMKAAYIASAEGAKELPISALYVWGTSIRFELPSDLSSLAFSGSLGADSGGGTVGREQSSERSAWTAKRLKD